VPSKSGKQHRLMALVANNPAAAKRLNIPQSVGKEYMKADKRKGKKYALGGPTSYSGEDDSDQGMKMSTRRGGSDDGMSFKQAFAAARKAGDSSFTWQGKKYTTEVAGSKKPSSEVKVTKTETSVEAPSSSGPRSGGRGSKPGMARVGSGRYDDPTSSFGERVTSPFRKLTDIFGRREEEDVMRNMNVSRDEARKRLDARKAATGMRGGGSIKKYRGGGSVSSASKRADGIAQKGKTRGKIC
jgi:hypothetical protein